MNTPWHILTGEYPPLPGGVSDYSHLIAGGLTDRGREVHVWTGGNSNTASVENGVTVHRMAGCFGPWSLRNLSRHFNAFSKPRRLYVQYVPYAFGWRGLNLPFALWLWWRRHWHGDDVLTLFHEVWFPWVRRPLKHNVFAAVQRVMAWFVTRASRRCHVSTPSWETLIRSVRARAWVDWRPIPATITGPVDPADVQAFRATLPAGRIVVHFGTYGSMIDRVLTPTLARLLTPANAPTLLLLGRGSEPYRATLIKSQPDWASKVIAVGALPADRVAVALSAADVALQPYPDGASTRRTSLMAALALGVPVVSTLGHLSEPFWATSGLPVVAIDPNLLAQAIFDLLNDADSCARIGIRGRELYDSRFSLNHTLDSLLQDES